MAGSQSNDFSLTKRGRPAGRNGLRPKVRFRSYLVRVRKFVAGWDDVDASECIHSSLERPYSGVRCQPHYLNQGYKARLDSCELLAF